MKKLFARIAAWVRAILRGRNKDQVVGGGGSVTDNNGVSNLPEVIRQD
jgi:hypothetical protein